MIVDRTVRLIGGTASGEDVTVAAIADETGCILGRASGPPADLVGTTNECGQQQAAISQTLAAARSAAGILVELPLEALVVGVAGYDEGLTASPVVDGTATRFAVLQYAEIAHAGALGGLPGIVVVADVRGIALGSAPGVADYVRAGGWGFPFGSDGDACCIGLQALISAMRTADRAEPSSVGDAALRFFEVPSLLALQHAYRRGEISLRKFAQFAPVVLDLAGRTKHFSGGPNSDAYYTRTFTVHRLAELAMLVDARLPASPERQFSYAGSLFADAGMCEEFVKMLAIRRCAAEARAEDEPAGGRADQGRLAPSVIPPRLRPVPPLGDALDGAIIFARRLARESRAKPRFAASDILADLR